jgi:hypothetical protein
LCFGDRHDHLPLGLPLSLRESGRLGGWGPHSSTPLSLRDGMIAGADPGVDLADQEMAP